MRKTSRMLKSFMLICVVLGVSARHYASAWQGKVVSVSDGDTITVMHEGRGEKVRLYGIDCPESHQDFGARAKHFSSSMVFGKTVDVEAITTDKYGRTVGIVIYDGQALNKQLINQGYAWVYQKYCDRPECAGWKQAEGQAMASKAGLWSMPNTTPPWEFRHGGKGGQALVAISTPQREERIWTAQASTVYHGNTQSRIFHRPGCRYYDCKNCTASLKSKEKASNAGYRPCKVCKP